MPALKCKKLALLRDSQVGMRALGAAEGQRTSL